MERVSVALRERLGNESARDLEEFFDVEGGHWREQVMQAATDRFENRLAAGAADLRLEMHKGFSDLRVEMHKGFSDLRVEMQKGASDLRVELLRWSFFFWIGQVAAIASLLAFMLRGLAPK